MTPFFPVRRKRDYNILKVVINYTYAIQENIDSKFWFTAVLPKTTLAKNVTYLYPKFHFPFKTGSSGESIIVWTAIAWAAIAFSLW